MYTTRLRDDEAFAPLRPPPPPTGQSVVVGDCLEVMKSLGERSVQAVVTSPPYNIGIAYKGYADNRPRTEYLAWMVEVGHAVKRVMKDDASFFLNVGGTNRDPWLPMELAAALQPLFSLQNHILWVKSISIDDDTVGHFKPITSDRYLNNNFEHMFHFTKSGDVALDRLAAGVPFKDKSNISRWGHLRDRRCRGNTWFIPYKTVRSKAQKFHHPCTFPVDLAEMCLRLHGGAAGLVLDPFVGTGSTLIAARRRKMAGLGIELNADYAQVARDRLAAEG